MLFGPTPHYTTRGDGTPFVVKTVRPNHPSPRHSWGFWPKLPDFFRNSSLSSRIYAIFITKNSGASSWEKICFNEKAPNGYVFPCRFGRLKNPPVSGKSIGLLSSESSPQVPPNIENNENYWDHKFKNLDVGNARNIFFEKKIPVGTKYRSRSRRKSTFGRRNKILLLPRVKSDPGA